MSTNPSPYTSSQSPTGAAGGGLSGTYPNPTVVLDGTATDIAGLGTQSAGATGKVPDAGHIHALPSDTPSIALGVTGTLATSLRRDSLTSNSFATTTGVAYFRAIWAVTGTQINNVNFRVGTAGKGGGSHGWCAVLDKNQVVQATSTDITDGATTFGTVNSDQAVPVWSNGTVASTKYTTSYTGIYYGVVSVTAGTMPTLCAGPNFLTGLSAQPNAPILGGTCSAATAGATPPAIGGTISVSGVAGDNLYTYLT